MENRGLKSLSKQEAVWVEAVSSYLKSGTFAVSANTRWIAQASCEVADEVLKKFCEKFDENIAHLL